ncbi:MAG: peptide chain release factor N(5)-glutamine methyltransferase [Alphaproteobacteria bacterium]|nr:peptide chain release factor N(5)-glutamine methyltransferase [Alphaproteobacteria bacterium]
MEINQALEILSNAGGPHAARIIVNRYDRMSRLSVMRAARQLRHGVPVAKIIHEKWFYGLPFYTNRHTLDPRPDTETLVESVLRDWKDKQDVQILDLGTGTGCILISLICNMSHASGVGVDVSRAALRVAKKNVKNMTVCSSVRIERGTFEHPNVYGEKFDVIVSNPPYVARGDKRVNSAAQFDPEIALYAENNGLRAYEQIARSAYFLLKSGGRIYLEIGAGMSRAVKNVFNAFGWKFVRADKDLSGKIRTLVFSL